MCACVMVKAAICGHPDDGVDIQKDESGGTKAKDETFDRVLNSLLLVEAHT